MKHTELRALIEDFKNGLLQHELQTKETLLQTCKLKVAELNYRSKKEWLDRIRHLEKELERKQYEYNEARDEIDEDYSDVATPKAIHTKFMEKVFHYIDTANMVTELEVYIPLVKAAYRKWNKDHSKIDLKITGGFTPAENAVGKKTWVNNKQEFADMIVNKYANNKNKYKSLRDATKQLFQEYLFDDTDWTVEKCYDLVRKRST